MMGKKIHFKNKTIFYALLFFYTVVSAQNVQQYWDKFNLEVTSQNISIDQIKLCMALKMLVLPEASKNKTYSNNVRLNGNELRYMMKYCASENFQWYSELLSHLQKDILTTQKILKDRFSENWTMSGLEKTLVNYVASNSKHDLNCYGHKLELSEEHKYIMYLALKELQHIDFVGIEYNKSDQRRIIIKLFERIYDIEVLINNKYELTPELVNMTLGLKEAALLEAREHNIFDDELYDQVSAAILNSN